MDPRPLSRFAINADADQSSCAAGRSVYSHRDALQHVRRVRPAQIDAGSAKVTLESRVGLEFDRSTGARKLRPSLSAAA
jgi:hypothetical protein